MVSRKSPSLSLSRRNIVLEVQHFVFLNRFTVPSGLSIHHAVSIHFVNIRYFVTVGCLNSCQFSVDNVFRSDREAAYRQPTVTKSHVYRNRVGVTKWRWARYALARIWRAPPHSVRTYPMDLAHMQSFNTFTTE